MIGVLATFLALALLGSTITYAVFGHAEKATPHAADIGTVSISQPLEDSYIAGKDEEIPLSVEATATGVPEGYWVEYTKWTLYVDGNAETSDTSKEASITFIPDTSKPGEHQIKVEVEYVVFFKAFLGIDFGYSVDFGAESTESTLTVVEEEVVPPEITKQPEGGEVNFDSYYTFSVDVENPKDYKLYFQWYRASYNGDEEILGGATDSSYAYHADTLNVYDFWVVIYVADSDFTLTSERATLDVLPDLSDYMPTIDTPTVDKDEIKYLDTFTLSVDAYVEDPKGQGTLTYQWYYNDGLSDRVIVDATDSSVTLDANTIGKTTYFVRVTNTISTGQSWLAESEHLVVDVKAPEAQYAKIFEQFDDQIASGIGQRVELSVVVSPSPGATVSYTWFGTDSTGSWIPFGEQAIDSTLVVPTGSEGVTKYKVVVTNKLDKDDTNLWFKSESKIATVTVNIENNQKPDPGPGGTGPTNPPGVGPGTPDTGNGAEVQGTSIFGKTLPWVLLGSAIIALMVGATCVYLKKNSMMGAPMQPSYGGAMSMPGNPMKNTFSQGDIRSMGGAPIRSNTSRTANKYLKQQNNNNNHNQNNGMF